VLAFAFVPYDCVVEGEDVSEKREEEEGPGHGPPAAYES